MEMIVSGHLATMEAWELPTFSSETNGGGWKVIRFMTEILHHLVCLKPCHCKSFTYQAGVFFHQQVFFCWKQTWGLILCQL